jgi:hypothetical protein
MQSKLWKTLAVVCAGLGAFGQLEGNEARACGNEVERETDPKTDALIVAEDALARGELATAARRVNKYFPHLRGQKSVSGQLQLRAARILALVSVRSRGAWLDASGHLSAPDDAARLANLEWAVQQLRLRLAASPRSSSVKADLGEAYAAIPRHRLDARMLLESLAQKRVLSSAYGYAVLANLRHADGDKKGAEKALSECKKRGNVAGLCVLRESGAKGKA